MKNDVLTIVIVGGVAGGASAAARARRCNEFANIIMFERDDHVSFANCGLPYYIGGEIQDRDKLLVAKPALFRDRFNIDIRTRHEVKRIDRNRKTVTVLNRDTGETFEQHYDKLILSPGASPLKPPIPGIDSHNVFTLRNLDDMDRIVSWLENNSVERATVVGAGYIGLEMVEQLHQRNIHIDLIELQDQVLPILDTEMASIVEEELRNHGVGVHLGSGVSHVLSESDKAVAIRTEKGLELPTDLVILGIGVRPEVELAKDTGLTISKDGGIAVNEFLQTNDPDIYAVGDAITYPVTCQEKPMRMPLAGPANRAGRLAGEHASIGDAPPMPLVLGTAIVRVFDRTVASTGLTARSARALGKNVRSVIIAAGHHVGYYPGAQTIILKLVYEADCGKVLGAQAVGGDGVDKRIDVIATSIHFHASVVQLAGVDLCYAPPFGSAKDPVHMAAFAACNDLQGITPLFQPDQDLEGYQILDIRTSQEQEKMSLQGSIHINLESLRDKLHTLNKKLPTVVVCYSGQRSHIAVRILKQHGFENVLNMTGGMLIARHTHKEFMIEQSP